MWASKGEGHHLGGGYSTKAWSRRGQATSAQCGLCFQIPEHEEICMEPPLQPSPESPERDTPEPIGASGRKACCVWGLQPAGLWQWPSGCVWQLLRMRKPGKVVTQSLPNFKIVPFKFEMSSEARETSSKPSLQNRCQIQRRRPEA